jgi:hypothetical protein
LLDSVTFPGASYRHFPFHSIRRPISTVSAVMRDTGFYLLAVRSLLVWWLRSYFRDFGPFD